MEMKVDFEVKLVRTVTNPAERRRRLLIAYDCLLKTAPPGSVGTSPVVGSAIPRDEPLDAVPTQVPAT
jgi:hypothetical protein